MEFINKSKPAQVNSQYLPGRLNNSKTHQAKSINPDFNHA